MCGLSFWLVCGGVCRLPMGRLGRLFVRVNSPIANGNRASNSALLRCPYEPRSTEEERRIRDETPGRKRAPHERQWRLSLPPLAGITTRGRVVGGRSPPSLVLVEIATRRRRTTRTPRARLRRRSEMKEGLFVSDHAWNCPFETTRARLRSTREEATFRCRVGRSEVRR